MVRVIRLLPLAISDLTAIHVIILSRATRNDVSSLALSLGHLPLTLSHPLSLYLSIYLSLSLLIRSIFHTRPYKHRVRTLFIFP